MDPKPIAVALAATLLSACVAPVPYNKLVPKTATYQQLQAQIEAAPATDAVQIEQLQNLERVTLASGLLFPEGSSEIDAAGKAALAQLAPALKGLSGQRIVVAGYTDNVPLGPSLRERFAGNVELSKARAGAVAEALEAHGVSAGLIATVGLGETHPVASNATSAGRAMNRRIEISVVEAPA